MKILWLANVATPQIAEKANIEKNSGGGWLVQLSEFISKKHELVYLFPQNINQELIKGKASTVTYYGFYQENGSETVYSLDTEALFKNIIASEKPDIVHIWGTEFPHTLEMVNAMNNPDKLVISIQGIISEIARVYYANLSSSLVKSATFRDFIRKDNIVNQKIKFEKRGEFEIEALKKTKYVIGRTDWDEEIVKSINKDIHYFHGGEVLRSGFYHGSWDYDKCEKHSILVSQGGYPIKGLHFAIEAFANIIGKYPEAKMYVAGGAPLNKLSIKGLLKQKTYDKYIVSLIKKNGLEERVVFTGALSEAEMKNAFLKANVFLLSSVIENSPNSLGEAMLLGTPCVATDVGGVRSMMENDIDGLLCQSGNPIDIEKCITYVFDNTEKAKEFSMNSRVRGEKNHGIEKCQQEYLDTYNYILNG